MTAGLPPTFLEKRAMLTRWLLDGAFPLWWTTGGDRKNGGFFEKIAQDGTAVEAPRRTFVTARHIYSYAMAVRLGWSGPAIKVVEHGLSFLENRCCKTDGTVVSLVAPTGEVLNADFDLYGHAFVLFALAIASGVVENREAVVRRATGLRDAIVKGWSHPGGGFKDGEPPQLPLKANPHMHLFEACLAWTEVDPKGDDEWGRIADEIAEIALKHIIQPGSGILLEVFDADWRPVTGDEGRYAEPGHQFEWAWLLARWGRWRNRPDAIAAARRLIEIADRYGTDRRRGVTFNEIWSDFTPKDETARLWPQAERIKAFVALAKIAPTTAERDAALGNAALAADGLRLYFDVPLAGLYHDKMRTDGSFIAEDALASSLYHIVCATTEMHSI